MVPQPKVFFPDTEAGQPVRTEVLPVSEPFEVGAWLAEEFTFHLLEFPGTEGEVAGSNLVAEGLTHLAHAEGQLLSGGALNVSKVDKDTLRGFRPEIAGAGGILRHADGGFEHQVEFADGGEVVLAADGADHIFLLRDEGVHLVEIHRVHVDLGMHVADQLVRAMAGLAAFAVQQRVGEAGHMAGGDPGLGIHDDRRIQPDVGGAFLHEFLPPRALNVVFQFHAERAVVPGVRQSAVDIRPGIYKAPAFAQGDDFVHGFFTVVHGKSPSFHGEGSSAPPF